MLALLEKLKFNIRDSCGGGHCLTGLIQYDQNSPP